MKAAIRLMFLFVALLTSASITFAQQEPIAKELVKAMKDAEKTAVLDADGRVTQIEIEYFSHKQTVGIGYQNGALSSVTLGDGTKLTILRGDKGKFEGFAFPDGKRVIFLSIKSRDSDFLLPTGLKVVNPDGKETFLPIADNYCKKQSDDSFSEVSSFTDDVADCRWAVAVAAGAAIQAVAACAGGAGPECSAALATAAVAAGHAAYVCRKLVNPELPPEN